MREDFSQRLAASGIQLVVETAGHYLFTRDNCIALVEREVGTIGSTGMMTEQGISYLIWRDGQAFLKSKSAEIPADSGQIAAVRRFSQDLAAALG
jgi:hypothetical protein